MNTDDVPRLVTVWCPDWSTVAARVPEGVPAAVFHANRVIARSPAAIAAGVVQGERRRSAQGTCPELLVIDHDPDRDARAFEPVVRAVGDMAPRLEVVEPGWVCLAARGPSRYFGGDHAMATRLAGMVRTTTGAQVGVGVADGRSASAIAARRAARTSSGVVVVAPGGSPEYVDAMSVAWLRELGEISPELVDLLTRLGLRTLGRFARLDAGEVLARFGAEGLHAHRLAGGSDTRASASTDPPPEWWIDEVFLEPVEQLETVVFVAKRLADSLVARLGADGRVCVRLVVVIETEHGERSERAWYRDHGLSASAMVERVRWQLEGWITEGVSGGISLVRLVPEEVRSDDGVQAGLWGGRSQADHDAERTIIRLTGLAGEQGVCVPMWVGGRLPTERYRWVPATSVDLHDPMLRLDRGHGPWPGGVPAPSPSVVPEQPIRVDVLDEQGNVVQVTGRGDVSGAPAVIVMASSRHRVSAWAGPWPVEQRWWSAERSRRVARFQMVTEDGVAHLMGVEHREWSIFATYS